MQIKTITYQRVINLGNYESKRLEMTAEISERDDLEFETSVLMEMVERKVREEHVHAIEVEISDLKAQLRLLRKEVAAAKAPPTTEQDNDIPDSF